MIDIHSHILPCIDDGPETIDESLDMCRLAALDGVKVIVATPHFKPGVYEASHEVISDLIATLTAKLREERIDLKILHGSEVTFTPEMPLHLRSERDLTVNGNGRYCLIEFPPAVVPRNWETVLLSILHSGLVPVIAHPERNLWFLNNPESLYSVVTAGVMVQITAMSITGEFEDDIQEFSIFLLEHNLAHVIATDAHSSTHRPPVLTEAVSIAGDVIGKERAAALVTSVPAAITEGKSVLLPLPNRPIQKKKRWELRPSF